MYGHFSEMVNSMPQNHELTLFTTLLAQMFPSAVTLGLDWMEVTLVLVLLMAPGVYQFQPVH